MDETIPSEYTLALRARDGDREAVAELTARARLFALAYAELRHYEDANDAVAAGLMQICRHIGDLRDPERVVAWMQSIVRNEARRLRRGATGANMIPLTEADTPTEDGEYSLLRLDIEIALGRMPDRQAEALRQFYLSDLPIQTIADRMMTSPGAV